MIVADVMVRTEHGTPLQQWAAQFGQADAATFGGRASGAATASQHHRGETGSTRPRAPHRRRAPQRSDHLDSLRWTTRWRVDIFQITSGRTPTRGERGVPHAAGRRRSSTSAWATALELVRPGRGSMLVTASASSAGLVGRTGDGAAAPGCPIRGTLRRTARSPRTSSSSSPNARPSRGAAHVLQNRGARDLARARSRRSDDTRPVRTTPRRRSRGAGWSARSCSRSSGIVIASAFAVGARRQLVTLGQLSGNGAAPARAAARPLPPGNVDRHRRHAASAWGSAAAALALLAPHADRIFQHDVASVHRARRPTSCRSACSAS